MLCKEKRIIAKKRGISGYRVAVKLKRGSDEEIKGEGLSSFSV